MVRKKKELKKLFVFAIVALLSAICELALYTFLFEILYIGELQSVPIAQVTSMIFNFSLNKLFTFKTGKKFKLVEFGKYIFIWLINILVTTVAMNFLLANTGIYPTVSRFIVMLIMFFFNFFAQKLFIFNKNTMK